MTTLVLLFFLAALFVATSRQASMLDISERMERFSRGFDLLLRIIPLFALAVFAALFLFVLKGRFYERLSHAVLVFALWLYAARFYWMLIFYFKHRLILVLSVFGMAGSAAVAITLTPLDRYVGLLHSFTGAGSVLIGCSLLIIYYTVQLFFSRKKTAKPEQP